jgi:hypothetical protein
MPGSTGRGFTHARTRGSDAPCVAPPRHAIATGMCVFRTTPPDAQKPHKCVKHTLAHAAPHTKIALFHIVTKV